ncbi:MAG: DUF2971 domain-containing protein [Microbacteriaceae bacterium]|nr:MAG: DUF2971 domain-containing protein [Microbacteriaceae bacterium]
MSFAKPAKTAPTMFHYTNAAGLVGIIRNRELWATGSNYLNDPTEVSFAATALAAALRERLDEANEDRDRAQVALDLLERAYVDPHSPDQYREDRSFITSFSRSDQSLTLWRLYGGRNGFCIGFDEDHLLRWTNSPEFPTGERDGLAADEREELDALRANFQLSARIEDVSYGGQDVAPILDEVMAVPYDPQQPYAHEWRLREAMNQLSRIKHPAYEDEKEARLIVQEVHHHAANPSVRVSAAGALVAYRRIVFPFEAVQSITMAPGANTPQQHRALKALMAQGGRGPYSHVEVRECGLPFVW